MVALEIPTLGTNHTGRMRRTPRPDMSNDLTDGVLKITKGISALRLHQVLAKLCPLRRRLASQRVRKNSGTPHPIETPETKVGSNDHPSGYGTHIYDPETEWTRELWPYEQAHPKAERHLYGPFPAHASWTDNPEQDVSPAGQHRPCTSPVPGPTFNINNANVNAIPCVPSPTRSHTSERQVRRLDQAPALTIVPPTTSIQLAGSECSANSACLPFSPYDYYSPNPASAGPSELPYEDVLPDRIRGLQSSHSSKPKWSTQQPRSPISLRSDGPAPSMSRSSSSERTESHSLPPSTPTHPQSRRAPVDSDNIICLGPLPDNIHLPSLSPRTIQFPPQASRPTPPRAVFTHEQDSSVIWPTTRPISPIQQDPLLHDSSPLNPYHSPVAPIFPRGQSALQAHRQHDWDLRRRSNDSLGSNFTVEEEARIQAQVVRNLSMLGQERVGGEGDIVHIPQPSARRFSFEYDR